MKVTRKSDEKILSKLKKITRKFMKKYMKITRKGDEKILYKLMKIT